MKGNFLKNPGRTKRRLWRVALHEAGHAVAAAYFLHLPTTIRLFHRGGLCSPVRSYAVVPAAEMIFTRCGPLAGSLATFPDCNRIPAGRPRFGRARFRRRVHRRASDKQHVATIFQSREPLKDAEIAELCREKWEATALNFVCCRRKLIVDFATKLYLGGTVFVPARPKDSDWAAEFVAGR